MFLVRYRAEHTVTCRAWCTFRMLCAIVITASATDNGLCVEAKSFPSLSTMAKSGRMSVKLYGSSGIGRTHEPLCPIRWNWSTQRFTVKRRGMSAGTVGYRPPRVKWSWRPLLLLLLLPILCRAAFYCRIIAHWRSGQEELVRS